MNKLKNIALFTDTDTDMTPEIASIYGYNLISMPYSINDKEIKPYEDFEVFDYHSYYDLLRSGTMPKTFAISPAAYINYFEPYFKDGKDILYVHFSRAMSGTFNSMDLAIEELKEKYPNRKIYTIDCKGITVNAYSIARTIGDLILEGKDLDYILNWAKVEVDKFATYFFVENLNFFARSGRVKGFSALMGNLIGIKPIINMDSDGMMAPKTKARGIKGAIDKIISYMNELGDHIKDYRIVVAHSDNEKLADLLIERVKEVFGSDLEIEKIIVNPTAGAHCGPDGVGITFHAIHR